MNGTLVRGNEFRYRIATMKRKIGVWLLVAAYLIFLYIAISAPFYAHAHPHLGAQMIAEYSAPWPVALMGSLGVVGIVLALIPIRKGERWAILTSFATFGILFVTRMATDPRCLVVLDIHQHGCHTFIIAIVLGVAGLILASFAN
jgi:hypothetical protein